MIKKLTLTLLIAVSFSSNAARLDPGTLMCNSELAIESVIDGHQSGNQNKVNAFIGSCSAFDVVIDVDVIEWSYFSLYSNVRAYDEFGSSEWWVTTSQIIVD